MKKIKIKDIDCSKYDDLCLGCPARIGRIYNVDTNDNCIICKKDFPNMLEEEIEVE